MEKYIFNNNYIVYSDGTVYSVRRKKFLKPGINSTGYKLVVLNGKSYNLHRIVAQAFIPNPDNLPQINHINSDKTDNRIDNLEWVTKRGNANHYYKSKFPGTHLEKRSNKFISQIWHNGVHKFLGRYNSQEEAHNVYLNYIKLHNL
jgi:hypothetical protein